MTARLTSKLKTYELPDCRISARTADHGKRFRRFCAASMRRRVRALCGSRRGLGLSQLLGHTAVVETACVAWIERERVRTR